MRYYNISTKRATTWLGHGNKFSLCSSRRSTTCAESPKTSLTADRWDTIVFVCWTRNLFAGRQKIIIKRCMEKSAIADIATFTKPAVLKILDFTWRSILAGPRSIIRREPSPGSSNWMIFLIYFPLNSFLTTRCINTVQYRIFGC